MTTTQSYHAFLCRERAACEGDLACFNDPKVVRNLNGQDRTYCYEHDPEHVHDFSAWLAATGQHLDPEDFTAWLKQREDKIS